MELHTSSARYYWILVLDMENFSDQADPVQVRMRAVMYDVVRSAVENSGLDWESLGVKDEGDGLLMFFPEDVPPDVIAGRLVGELSDGLAGPDVTSAGGAPIRLRVALHHGWATPDATGWPGDATNFACRLVDVQLLREVLGEAPRAHLAVVASDRFYRAVIRPGHPGVDPSTYASVLVDLKKAPGTRAWIQVPGYPMPPGLPSPEPRRDARTAAAPRPNQSFVFNGPVAGPTSGDQIFGTKEEVHHHSSGGATGGRG